MNLPQQTMMGPMADAMAQPLRRYIPRDVLLLGLAAIWLGFLSWVRPLGLPDEGRYPGVAWEMLRTGMFGTPTLDGLPYFHKPPLFYWLAAFSMKVFGMNEWAVRAPSLLGAWLSLAGLHAFVRTYRGETAARAATLLLASMPLFFGSAQFANLDMLVAGMITLCVLAAADTVLRRAQGRPYRAMSLAAAALAALAVLSKGLIGLVLPGAILALWLIARRDGRGFAALVWPPALLVFCAIAAPWFVLMEMRHPGFVDYFFVYQQFERFSGTGFNNVQPFWFYVPVVLGLSMPWALWGRPLLRRAFWRGDADGLRALMGLWFAVVLVFFSLPQSKLVGYILPLLAPLAFLLAQVLLPMLEQGGEAARKYGRRAAVCLVVAVVICVEAVAVVAVLPQHSAKPMGVKLRAELEHGDTVVMLNTYAFDLPFYARLRDPAWVVGDWRDRSIEQRDNWRKELYDAARFDPQAAERTLISAEVWRQRMCAAPPGARFWVWGKDSDAMRYAVLSGLPAYFSDGRQRMWRIDVNGDFRRRICDGTPKGG